MARKILFVTGTRADFGKIEPLALAAQASGHEVGFFVTGMHMLERYGATKHEIHRLQGFEIHEYINQRLGDPQDMILSKTVLGFSDWVYEHKPDLVVVHGDRIEALAVALVCATNYIRCAHIEGGEVSGTIDEIYRHCNTKLCAYHFVSSASARDRVMSLGESPESIFNIGSPELDYHKKESSLSLQEVKEHYEIPFEDFGIVTFHPVTSERENIGSQAACLFDTLDRSGKNFVVISPNNDPGCEEIFDAISRLEPARFRHLPSMRFAYFSLLMKNASVIVGNSSAGVREAPFLGVPSLNIGSRQHNRSISESICNASAFDTRAIDDFLTKFWGNRFERDESFGSGDAALLFSHVLKQESFWNTPLQKGFND